MLGIVDCLLKRGQAIVGVLSPYPECDWNQGYHLVSPHLDADQGKVVKLPKSAACHSCISNNTCSNTCISTANAQVLSCAAGI